MISVSLRQVPIKNTGSYLSRAEPLAQALGIALKEEFGIYVPVEKRGQNPKQPCYAWVLPGEDVAVMIEKSGTADPRIWVYRNDPIRKPPGETDWRNESFERYGKSPFDLEKVAAYIREQVEYNRKLRKEHEENEDAFGRDLVGLEIPDGVSIERDPKTGRYKLFMHVSIKELRSEEVKILVAACRDFKNAVDPVTQKGGARG